ncbi:MAG: transposase [Aquabacterium sp.]|jgi:putative transposase
MLALLQQRARGQWRLSTFSQQWSPMARLPRADLPGWPQLVCQRAHDGANWLRDGHDLSVALAGLREVSRAAEVRIHAYSLTAEQLHLLVTPDAPEAVSRMMQAFGRRYVAAFNRHHQRSGGLWAGRYRSVVLDEARFLLDAMQWVDEGPAGVPEGPHASSLAHHLGQRTDPLVVDHAAYWGLGNTPFERHLAWQQRLAQGLSPAVAQVLARGLHTGWPLVSTEQAAALAAQAGRRLVPARRGRPRKSAQNDSDPN